jgi:CRP-like cAMP-binding protein
MTRLPLVSPLDRILFLKAQRYLTDQPPDLLTALASYTEERFYSAGALIRSGKGPVDRVLFLGRGRVEIGGDPDSDDDTIEIDAPGVIGLPHHFAGVAQAPRVQASTDTLCLEITTADLDQILEDYFSLFLEFARRGADEALAVHRRLGASRPPEAGFASHVHSETPIQLDLVERLARARHAPLLRGTNLTVLGQLLRGEKIRRIEKGQAIWKEGDTVDSMAMVLDGHFRSEGRYGQATAPSGATLGAWEILSDAPHFEGWIADSPSRVLSIRKDLFTDLLEDHFEFAQTYLRRSSEKTLEAWALEARFAGSG